MAIDAEQLKRVSALFDEFADLVPDQCAVRLAALAATEPEVADELTRWLAQDQRSQGELDLLTKRFQAIAETAPVESGDRSGQRIGDCTLLRRVGRGGMGEVYEARRDGAEFEQKVAVKLLRRGLDSEDMVRRFVRERRILAQLEHPGIARLIDGGMSDDGQPYLVMEFVDGQELIIAANARALDLDARLRLFVLICDAVAYAHRRLIVHRDLKPANVLLTADQQPKLLDFGIAKLLDEVDDEHLTGTGMRVLTPGYAAPEQILGQPISTATDVYALGVILYELMTGLSPHQRRGKDLQSVTRDIDRESLLAPSAAVIAADAKESTTQLQRQRLARRLSGDLDTITLHALKREPERRYQGAAELADDIRRHLDGLPVRAEVDTLGYRLGKFVKRHRGGVTSAALGLLGIVAGLVVALSQADIARKQAARAEAEAARAIDMGVRNQRVKEFLISVFSQEDTLRRDARGPLTMAEAFEDTLKRIDSELGDDPALQGALLDDFGEIVTAKGDFARAQGLFERALKNAEVAHGANDPAVAESLVNLAALSNFQGQSARAKPLLVRAVAILEKGAESDPISLANAVGALAAAERNAGNIQASITGMRRALKLYGGPEGDHPAVLVAMHNLATVLIDQQAFIEAEPLIRKSIALTEAKQGVDAAPLAILLTGLERVLSAKGALDEETSVGARRLAIARKNFQGDHPWIASALSGHGWQLVRAGDWQTGEAMIAEAIAMHERQGRQDVNMLNALHRLGQSQSRRGDGAAAFATLDRATAVCMGTDVMLNQVCLTIRANRAGADALRGNGAAALLEADAALAELRNRLPQARDEQAQALEARAAALFALSRFDEAVASQREALALYVTLYGAGKARQRPQQTLDRYLAAATSGGQN